MSKQNVIIIMNEDEQVEAAFIAPNGKAAARSLWTYLVKNLRSGLFVDLWLAEQGKLTGRTSVEMLEE